MQTNHRLHDNLLLSSMHKALLQHMDSLDKMVLILSEEFLVPFHKVRLCLLDRFFVFFDKFKILTASRILNVPMASALQYIQVSQNLQLRGFVLLGCISHQAELVE